MNYKLLIAFAGTVLLVGMVTDAFAATFLDTQGTNFEEAFAYLSEQNIVHGYSDGTGKPNAPLNRVEALKVILEARGDLVSRIQWFRSNMPPISLFYDTDQTAWYGPYVEVAFEETVITGYPDGTLRPAQLLTVEEAVTMLMRAFGEQSVSQGAGASPYIENRSGEWFTAYINRAVERNLIMHTGTLRLGATITRGQFFDMVYRLHSIRAAGLAVYAGREPQQQGSPLVRQQPAQPTTTPPVGGNAQPLFGPNPGTGGGPGGGGAAIQTFQGADSTTNVVASTTIDHPYASEKYFAVTIPSLGITDLPIIHPVDALTKEGVLAPLKDGVGHLFSYPGGGGKIMVYGHSSGYPWDVSEYTKIFRKVNELSPGDRIYVTYSGKLYVYEVSFEQTIPAAETEPFNDDGTGEELILYTCWPPDSIAERYLVHALPVETIAAR